MIIRRRRIISEEETNESTAIEDLNEKEVRIADEMERELELDRIYQKRLRQIQRAKAIFANLRAANRTRMMGEGVLESADRLF